MIRLRWPRCNHRYIDGWHYSGFEYWHVCTRPVLHLGAHSGPPSSPPRRQP